MSDVWKHCVEVLRRELTSQQFNTWILPLQAEEHGDRLYVLAPNRFVLDWVRGRFAPQGVAGGGPAALNEFRFQRDDGEAEPPMASKMVGIHLKRGQAVRLETPGGGGYGDPARRDPTLREDDRRDGLITDGPSMRC